MYKYGGGRNRGFLLDDVDCTGNETKLDECTYTGVNMYNCRSGTDEAGVICTGEYQCLHVCNQYHSTAMQSST